MKANLPQNEPNWLRDWDSMNLYEEIRRSPRGSPNSCSTTAPVCERSTFTSGRSEQDLEGLHRQVPDDGGLRLSSTFRAGIATGCPSSSGGRSSAKRAPESAVDIRVVLPRIAMKWVVFSATSSSASASSVLEDPYLTISKDYEATIAELAESSRKGMLYRGLKPVYWCPYWRPRWPRRRSSTTRRPRTPSTCASRWWIRRALPEGSYLVIWTTTPWTIPANLAVAVHPEVEYGVYPTEKGTLVVATALAEKFFQAVNLPAGSPWPAEGRRPGGDHLPASALRPGLARDPGRPRHHRGRHRPGAHRPRPRC